VLSVQHEAANNLGSKSAQLLKSTGLERVTMYIYKHHTSSDVIDLDPDTGRWTPVADPDRPLVGALGITCRDAYPIRGSYTKEDGKRYCMYWTSDRHFEFLPANQAPISIAQRGADGSTKMDDIGMRCTIEPAKYSDGRLRQGLSKFKLVSGADQALFELTYHSDLYLQMAGADFTSASGFEDIGDWDFFVALKNAIETLTDEASTGRVELRFSDDDTALIQVNESAETPSFAPKVAPDARAGESGPLLMICGISLGSRWGKDSLGTKNAMFNGCGAAIAGAPASRAAP
jgi:hypothetical protein